MYRSTALRSAHTIAGRLNEVTGLIHAPCCNWNYVRVSRAWIFGSTVKGAYFPNDLDVLVEWRYVGERRSTCRGARIDKEYLRRYGCYREYEAKRVAVQYLRGRLKHISVHTTELDDSIAYPRVMIYPRNDLHTISIEGEVNDYI